MTCSIARSYRQLRTPVGPTASTLACSYSVLRSRRTEVWYSSQLVMAVSMVRAAIIIIVVIISLLPFNNGILEYDKVRIQIRRHSNFEHF